MIRLSNYMPKSGDPSSEDLIASIGAAVMRWQDAAALYDEEVGARLGLSLTERQCLACLTRGPRPAREIAEATRLTRAAITTLVDRLEERGLVRRTPDTADRRQVLVSITPKARRQTAQYYGPIAAAGAVFLAGFSRAELAAIRKFVDGALELQQGQIARLERDR
ncbi:MAG: MarR family transcriptional regulator [Hyphomicrobiaceae bacterium]|nr:MarR family transcriptional regulator [Hyphomicrobiaceae bacterium]